MTTLLAHSPVPPSSHALSHTSRAYVASPTLSDPHSQLDDIISDLLSDRAFTTDQEEDETVDQPQQGSITRQDGNNRTTVSWQKMQSGPSRSITVSSHSVSRPSPNSRVESERSHHQSMSMQRLPEGDTWKGSRYDEDQWTASDRYLYKTTEERKTYESKSEVNKQNTMFDTFALTNNNDHKPLPSARKQLLNHDELESTDFLQHPPYRKELQEVLLKRSLSETKKSNSDAAEGRQMSWLDSQREKLNQKREVRSSTASRSFVVQSDTEENRVVGRRAKDYTSPPYRQPPPLYSSDSLDELSNFLTESSRDLTNTLQQQQQRQINQLGSQKSQKYHQLQQRSSSVGAMRAQKTEPCFFVSGLEKPAFSKQHTKYVFSVSPSPSTMVRDDSLEDQFNRTSCLSPPPPKRGDSSKEAVQRRNVVPRQEAPSVDDLDQTLARILAANNQPKPETDLIIEEEVISLEPIGRGIHTLEPDSETLSRSRSRAGTPAPAYPGFPTPGYKSPSLRRMQGAISPTPSGFRSPTPARMITTPVVNGPGTPLNLGRATSTTSVKSAYNSSTANASHSIGKEPSSTAAIKSTIERQNSARLATKEDDLEEAVNFMMANAEPFNKSKTASVTQRNEAVRSERMAASTLESYEGQPQGVPATLVTRTTITETKSSNDMKPNTPSSQKNLSYLEQQQSVIKQQQQLLLQSQQLQQLQEQERALKQKQLQLQWELQQQQQQQESPSAGSGWVLKEEKVTETIKKSGNGSVAGNLSIANASGTKKESHHDLDLEREVLDFEKHMQQNASNSHSSLQQGSVSSLSKTNNMQQQQFQKQQIVASDASAKSQNQSNAVQQLNELSNNMKQFQQQDLNEIQVCSAISQQQRQQVARTKFGLQELQQQQGQKSELAGGTSCAGSNCQSGHREEKRSYQYDASESQHSDGTLKSASEKQDNFSSIKRSPSPSLWTNETLRSYTARMHSSSPSPLLPPGSTLPKQGRASPYFGQSRNGSTSYLNEMDTLNNIPRFVRDSSRLWHRPNITREEAVSMLKDKLPGSFIVRNSSTFQGAYGLALKVAQLPPNVQLKGGDPQTELVRHFLIEPTIGGVRLKGCSNEPVFSSLAALVYQHTQTALSLPCKLILPEDIELKFVDVTDGTSAGVLAQGAACNVLYLNSVDTESLTGPSAISTAIKKTFSETTQPKTTVVQFKVSAQGITLTDHQRSIFFRRHYPLNTVSYCGIEDEKDRRIFGFVARKPGSATENACHIFVESDPGQPASAIVDFMTKIMVGQGQTLKLQ